MTWFSSLVSQLKGRSVGVVGGGVSGLAAAKLLLRLGAHVFVSEAAPKDKVKLPELLSLSGGGGGIDFEFGGHTEELFRRDLLVLSPGVDPRQEMVAAAFGLGLPYCGELELAYQVLQRIKPMRYCAITGTNGKTTTTALIGHLLKTAGKNVFVGGNIGAPLSGLALTALDGQAMPEAAVLELSSFQCEGLIDFAADVAVFLNLTPDHLDRYASVKDYGEAKARLFALQPPQTLSVLNLDDSFVRNLKLRSRIEWFSTEGGAAHAMLQPDDLGVLNRGSFRLADGALRGKHNRQNQLAAVLAARALGVSDEAIQQGLNSFAGVEHRIEKVAEHRGVTYYNDSKATNDDAAAKALDAFTQPIIWLAGGRDKGGGYALSHAAAKGKVKLAVVFGEAAPLISQALAKDFHVERAKDLKDALTMARHHAVSGDVVLLSPACSSYDQFKNYEERGRLFKQWVAEGVAEAIGGEGA